MLVILVVTLHMLDRQVSDAGHLSGHTCGTGYTCWTDERGTPA